MSYSEKAIVEAHTGLGAKVIVEDFNNKTLCIHHSIKIEEPYCQRQRRQWRETLTVTRTTAAIIYCLALAGLPPPRTATTSICHVL